MNDLRLVVDHESENECDNCGENIPMGKNYYASPDDKLILCVICYIAFEETGD